MLWLLDLFLLRRNSQCNKSVCLFCDELLKYKQIREFRNAEAVNGFLLHWNQWFWIENIFRNLFIVPVIFNKCCILKLVFNIQYPYKLFGEPSIIYLYLVLRAFAYIGRVKKKEFPHKFNSQFKFQLTHRSSPFILFSHTHLKITKNTHIYIYICAYIYFFPFAAVALKKQINKCILKYAAKAPFKMQNKYGEKNDRHQSKFY